MAGCVEKSVQSRQDKTAVQFPIHGHSAIAGRNDPLLSIASAGRGGLNDLWNAAFAAAIVSSVFSTSATNPIVTASCVPKTSLGASHITHCRSAFAMIAQ